MSLLGAAGALSGLSGTLQGALGIRQDARARERQAALDARAAKMEEFQRQRGELDMQLARSEEGRNQGRFEHERSRYPTIQEQDRLRTEGLGHANRVTAVEAALKEEDLADTEGRAAKRKADLAGSNLSALQSETLTNMFSNFGEGGLSEADAAKTYLIAGRDPRLTSRAVDRREYGQSRSLALAPMQEAERLRKLREDTPYDTPTIMGMWDHVGKMGDQGLREGVAAAKAELDATLRYIGYMAKENPYSGLVDALPIDATSAVGDANDPVTGQRMTKAQIKDAAMTRYQTAVGELQRKAASTRTLLQNALGQDPRITKSPMWNVLGKPPAPDDF